MHKLRSGLREAVAALALLSLAACAGKGCSCVQPIKGGFPVDKRQDNAIQLRATQGLFDYLKQNGAKLIPGLIGGNTFNVPPSCGGSTEICCAMPNQVCQLSFDFKTLNLTPTAPNSLHLSTDVVVKTVMDLPVKAPVVGLCMVSIDTTKASPPTMNVTSDLAFTVDKNTDTTGLSASSTAINIQSGAISLSGGLGCAAADTIFKPIVVSLLESQVASQLQTIIGQQACEKCMTKDDCNSLASDCKSGTCVEADGTTCVPSLGLEGRMNVGSALAKFSPGLQAYMDVLAVAGGYASADTGLSLGLLGGAQGDPHSDCVPVVPPPMPATIPQSETFHTDVLPDGATPYHLGIGVHKSFLDTAGWAAFDGGALCLHVGTPSVALLSSKTIGLLIPSLADVVHVSDAPMYIAIKPSKPPTFTLGKGTFKTDAMGRRVVDDPLLHIAIPGFSIDFFAWADDRYVRVMTLNADVDLPLSLEVDGDGKLTPIFGDLTQAFQNVTVTNSELLAESPEQLAEAFPMLLGVAVGQLTGALSGISLPALMGLQVKPIAITSTDPDANGVNQFLSIFADVSAAQTLTTSLRADTQAWLASTSAPPTEAFAVGARTAGVPTAVLQLDGRGPGPLEYAWSVDGGPWTPYSETTRAVVTDPQLWMQGRHTVDVRARVVGQPATTDPSPARVEVLIDTVAPTGSFDVAGHELRVDASDAVSPASALQFRFAVGGADFGPWIAADHVVMPAALDAATLRVQVRDEAGNIGDLGFHGRTTAPSPAGCNCDVGGHGSPTLPALVIVGLALLLLRRRARRLARGGGVLLVVLAGTSMVSTGCSHGLGKGDFASPDDEIGRYHDVAVQKGALYLSAYDDTFGDLVYARLGDPKQYPSWEIVDGVDLTASVDTKGGFRHGISDPGPDVGMFTSIAVSNGHPMIAYWDATNSALKFARGGHPWDVSTVDAGSGTVEAGMYAALSVDKKGVPSIAYVATGLPSGAGFTSELRVATAANDHPGAGDWTITAVDSTAVSCAGLCADGSACVVPSMVNGMPNSDPSLSTCVTVDATPCAATCSDTQACIMGTCTDVLQAPKAPDLLEGTGLFVNARRDANDQLVLVYYDRMQGDLKLATNSGGGWQVSFLDGNDPTTDVGQFASAELAADGTLHVAYVDAIHDQLLYKQVAPGQMPGSPEIIDDGARSDGPHSVGGGANLILDGSGNPRVVYQDQNAVDLELATRDGSWTHQDLHTGIPGYGFYPHQVIADGKLYLTEFVYDRQNGPGAPLGTLQISVSAP